MEKLLKAREVWTRLGIGRSTFYRNMASFLADGLQEVKVNGGERLFREASVDALIAEAANSGYAIGELRDKRRGRRAQATPG
jgi:predicted DNA-binding transcriptional regulator AlpA